MLNNIIIELKKRKEEVNNFKMFPLGVRFLACDRLSMYACTSISKRSSL
jgi:hypothetical protein